MDESTITAENSARKAFAGDDTRTVRGAASTAIAAAIIVAVVLGKKLQAG